MSFRNGILMDDHTVFVRTPKGRDAVVGILSAQLAPQLRILLALINGKSDLAELRRKIADQIPVGKVRAAIDVLLTHDYIEIPRNPVREDTNLDFTNLNSAKPGPRPTHK